MMISRSVFATRAMDFCIVYNLSDFIIFPLNFLNNTLLLYHRIYYRTLQKVFHHDHRVGTYYIFFALLELQA